MLKSMSCFCVCLFACILLTAELAWAADPIVIDFEDENIDVWDIVDEPPENLGDQGPSTWDILESANGFDGMALTQTSNIWGEPEDHMLMGTIIYYNQQQFKNFRLDVDVIAIDNDGMGFVWGYQDLDRHYRFQLMNDRWPEIPPIDGFNGPYLISHKRISDESPWYELMDVLETDEYIPYTQGFEEINHWTLEVIDGNYTITTTDSFGDTNTLSGFDDTYEMGYVGIQLYAQNNVEFDNFVITPLDSAAPGDFDENGTLDAADMDLLSSEVLAGTNNTQFDLTGDQLVNQADRQSWVHDLKNTYFGDANLDGEFNSTDFVVVFQASQYEDGVARNSGWATGDWNGDKEFDSADFVVAFQDSGFEAGPRQLNAVPEPSSILLLAFALGLGCLRTSFQARKTALPVSP